MKAGKSETGSIHSVYIDRSVLDTALAKAIRGRFPEEAVHVVSGREGAEAALDTAEGSAPKGRLFITRERGRWLRPCPGSPGMACCNLFVLNPIMGCPYDCTYCFLQDYQQDPFITLHANLEDLEREVERLRARISGKVIRICTGEFADSLALEPLVEVAAHLVKRFAGREGILLELKTKSDRIGHLLSLDHRKGTVLSWSLNTNDVAALEERGAPSPEARLKAAARAVDAGYPVSFHFDPLVRTRDWQEAYPALVGELFRAVPAETVAWISLGGFRYSPAMKDRILQRHPGTRLFLEEFVRCPDGKYRYFSRHRMAMYREMTTAIQDHGPRIPLYLCMESDYMWRKVFGGPPEASCLLAPLFSPRPCIF